MSQKARDYQPGECVPGTVYEVVRLIGSGGMGTVYDVEDTTIGKRYVLKTLHPQLGAREDLARRMQNEARTLARLNHSNIVDVITAGVTTDELRLPYYVMERLSGQSLRVVLEKKGQLELPHACHIGIDLLDALDHAHDKGVIHRDVKPDNIFLHRTSGGVTVTKLLDFGIVSLLDARTRETAGRFLGTLRYAAPEQLRGESPTPQMDVYAAGLVLYEMIAGHGPFDDEASLEGIGAAHMERHPPFLSRFVPIPGELEALVMAALAKAPEARPRDAFSFAAGLRKLKRLVSDARSHESTEERATAVSVIGPESAMAAFVEVQRRSTNGPYVISPGRDHSPPARTSFPKTTIPGIPTPTLGPSLVDPITYATTATTPGGPDRVAPTHSFVPDTIASPKGDTESLAPVSGGATQRDRSPTFMPLAKPQGSIDSPLRWPPERASAMSEEPHVQTLPWMTPRSRQSVARIVAAFASLGVAAAAGIFFLARRPSSSQPKERAETSMSSAIAAPMETPASSTPALTVASQPPAALDAGRIAGGPVKKSAAPLASATRGKPRLLLEATPTKLTSASLRDERPGPGF